jgi:hypothetical protein
LSWPRPGWTSVYRVLRPENGRDGGQFGGITLSDDDCKSIKSDAPDDITRTHTAFDPAGRCKDDRVGGFLAINVRYGVQFIEADEK